MTKTSIHNVLDRAETEHKSVSLVILSFVDLPAKALVAGSCKGTSLMMKDASFWTSLDFRGTKSYSKALALALQHPVVSSAAQEVVLEFCKEVTDGDLAQLAARGGWRHLNFNALHKVTDAGVVGVCAASGRALEALHLYWQHARSSAAVSAVAKACPNLTTLNLSGCQQLEDSGVRAVARACRSLTWLDVTRCPLLTDDALEFMAPRLPQLASLNLYADSQFSDRGYRALAQLPNLTFLDLCGATKLSPDACAAIARGCPGMRSLNLSWCVPVNDAALAAVAAHCRHLELLSVFGLLGVTDASLDALAATCAHTLATLDVHGCRNVTRQADHLLLKQFPRLTCFSHHS